MKLQLREKKMNLQTIDQGIVSKVGPYADAIVIPADYEQILVSGTPGIDQDGELPADITGQSEQAWENVVRILEAADATVGNIVFIRQWLTNESDVDGYLAVRSRYLNHRPGMMLGVVKALLRPEFLLVLEVVAARPIREP
ncbi:enamine deaminase RidA [Diaminobutyricibacter tongyongensis]|uniref:Enamine deaminase RidA n=1 Tax=Leifsonia tongyongensis TaxID=1268043 RepID=A0A6L9Y2I7_9MICO|nr:Rid family hydrolase [Diaminobutyricibacter tongyongensis]NEN07786.1 enamine deaminase RidA [Diaminobutyricibacter tongyongensis]